MDIKLIFSIINIVLIALIAIVVLLKARGGKKRGAYRQPIHLAGVLLAAITAFLVTTVSCGALLSSFEGKEMSDLISAIESVGVTLDAETKDMIGSFDAGIIAYVLAIPLAFISPIIFLLVYSIAGIIFGIARALITKICKIPRRIDTKGKTIGFMLGALEGVLVMVFMLLPLTALLRLGVPVIKSVDIPGEELAEVFDGVEGVYESPAIKLVSFAGGDFLADELSSVNVEDSHFNLTDELSIGVELTYEIMELVKEWDNMAPTDRETSITKAIALLDQSSFIPGVLAGTMNIAADAIEKFMPEMPEDDPLAPIMDELTGELKDFLKGSSSATVIRDLEVFGKLFILLDTNEVLNIISEEPDKLLGVLTAKNEETEKTLVSEMIAVLNTNSRTASIITTLNKVSISLMLNNMQIPGVTPEVTEEVYGELKGGINNVISVKREEHADEEAYKEALGTEIKGTVDSTIDKIMGKLDETPENEEQRKTLEDVKESLKDEEVLNEVTEKVVEFLDKNEELKDMEEIDDATLLDFVTSNFGDIFKDMGGLPDSGESSGNGSGGDLPDNLPDNLPDMIPGLIPGLNGSN